MKGYSSIGSDWNVERVIDSEEGDSIRIPLPKICEGKVYAVSLQPESGVIYIDPCLGLDSSDLEPEDTLPRINPYTLRYEYGFLVASSEPVNLNITMPRNLSDAIRDRLRLGDLITLGAYEMYVDLDEKDPVIYGIIMQPVEPKTRRTNQKKKEA